jgi:hypothetical protein
MGLLWHRADSVGKQLLAWARLGPLGTARRVTGESYGRYDRGDRSRDRSPNGVAWRFPDWTAVGFRFRGITAAA